MVQRILLSRSQMFPTLHDVLITVLRWLAGISVATLVGFLASTAGARWRPTSTPFGQPQASPAALSLVDFLRSLPVIALVPLVQLMGVDEGYKIGLIAWAATFPILIAVRQALSRPMVDAELMISGAGLGAWQTFRLYALPKALTGLIAGVEVSIGVAWIAVVAAEWLGNYSAGFWSGGLGVRVVAAHDANSWAGVLACLGVFGLLGTGSSFLWRTVAARSGQHSNE